MIDYKKMPFGAFFLWIGDFVTCVSLHDAAVYRRFTPVCRRYAPVFKDLVSTTALKVRYTGACADTQADRPMHLTLYFYLFLKATP
jgi:hypothetical protein